LAFSGGGYLLPLLNNTYALGATYNWDLSHTSPTKEARNQLLIQAQRLIGNESVEVVNHRSGIRPAIKGRRPVIGKIPGKQFCYMLNGLGSKGISLAPWLAKELLTHFEEAKPSNPEVDIQRFGI
jgi:glycine/D-amino acid oxidase-like deaminating enzyme